MQKGLTRKPVFTVFQVSPFFINIGFYIVDRITNKHSSGTDPYFEILFYLSFPALGAMDSAKISFCSPANCGGCFRKPFVIYSK